MTCVLVLGVPRSGTSLVAGVCHRLGVDMGRECDALKDHWNPEGYFSCVDGMGVLAAFFERTYPHVRPLPPAGRGPARRRLAEYLRERQAESGGPWGLKDHRLPFVFDELRAAFPAAVLPVAVVRTRRAHARSAASWAARMRQQGAAHDFAPCHDEAESARFLAQHRDAVDACCAGWRGPLLEVDFDALVDEPAAQVARLAGFLGRPVSPAALALVKPEHRRY